MTETDLHPELRPLLFSIAYRMIGSVSEAEDIVQEAFLRYHRAQPAEVDSQGQVTQQGQITKALADK